MVARNTPHLTRDTFLDVVVKMIFPLLSLGRYLLTVLTTVNYNGYLTRDSNENAHSITTNCNVSVASWVIPLATIPLFRFCHDSLNSLNSVKFI